MVFKGVVMSHLKVLLSKFYAAAEGNQGMPIRTLSLHYSMRC